MKVAQAGSLRGSWPIANRPQLIKLPHNRAPRRFGKPW